MSWFGADKTIDATGNAVEKAGKALDSLFTSDDERLTKKEAMERLRQNPALWAHELNLLNAQDSSLFNSGWRPMLGWVGGVSLAMFFIPQYLMGAILWGVQCHEIITTAENLQLVVLPDYPVTSDAVMELVLLVLGGGVLRSFDKKEGTAKK